MKLDTLARVTWWSLLAVIFGWCCVLGEQCHAGTFRIMWTAPSNGDSSCGVTGPVLHDPVTTLLRVRSCGAYDTTYSITSAPGESLWANVAAPSGHVYFVELHAKNAIGRSCGLQALSVALPDTVVPPPPPPPPPNVGGISTSFWTGSKNNSFGTFLVSRSDTTIDFAWGLASPNPGVPADSFSVRFTGAIIAPTSGSYIISVRSADGFRLWIDGVKVKDWWQYQFAQTVDIPASLSQGTHDLRLDYFSNVGDSSCKLYWSGPGFTKRIIERGAWQ